MKQEPNPNDPFGVTRNPIFIAIHWLYLLCKWVVILGLLTSTCNAVVFMVMPEATWLMKLIPLTILVTALIVTMKNIYKKFRGY